MKGVRGRSLQLVYSYLLSISLTSVETEHAYSATKYAPVSMMRHGTLCASYDHIIENNIP